MSLKGCVLLVSFFIFTGCVTWAPSIVGTSLTGIDFYRSERAEEVYKVSMDRAYVSAIKTVKDLALEITGIKRGEHNRIIKAQDPNSKCKVNIELEDMGDGEYIKATFKALKYVFLPDRLYSRMIMKEFDENLREIREVQNKTLIYSKR